MIWTRPLDLNYGLCDDLGFMDTWSCRPLTTSHLLAKIPLLPNFYVESKHILIYIYIHIHTYIYIHVYISIYICYHEKNVPSRLSPQWLCGNACTWAHTLEPYIMCPSAWVFIFFMITYILRSSCFCEIWAHCVSWIAYDHLYIYIYIYQVKNVK